jgi:8-oxo-dGTP pyrophosphatase MutT (NUDIX family)
MSTYTDEDAVAYAAALLLEAAATTAVHGMGVPRLPEGGDGEEGGEEEGDEEGGEEGAGKPLTAAKGIVNILTAPARYLGRTAAGALARGKQLFAKKEPDIVPRAARVSFVRLPLSESYPQDVRNEITRLAERRKAPAPPPPIDPTSKVIAAAALASTDVPVAGTPVSLPAEDKKGAVVGVYIIWKDHLLIHQRGESLVYAGTISTPGGETDKDSEGFAVAALRELKEEAQFTIGGAELTADKLTPFRILEFTVPVTNAKQNAVFFVVKLDNDAKPTIGGPDAAHMKEVMPLDSTVMSLPGDDAGDRYRWVPRDTLAKWLEADGNRRYKNDLFYTTLVTLNKWLGPPATVGPAAPEVQTAEVAALSTEDQIPSWATKYFTADDLKAAISEKCRTAKFPTEDCLAAEVKRDIRRADDYKANYRLTKRGDSALDRYRELKRKQDELYNSNDQGQETQNKLERIKRALAAEFYDEQILVREHGSKKLRALSIPNPYRALAYREDPNVRPNFANPNSGAKSQYDPGGKMFAQNTDALKAIAPSEMIADHDMAVALLESLWYCGRNPTVSNDPRCFPLRLMGELREWEANKQQMRSADAAKAILNDNDWSNMKSWLTGLLKYTEGTMEYPWYPPLIDAKPTVAAVPAPAVPAPAPAPAAAAPLKPVAAPAPAPLKPGAAPAAAAAAPVRGGPVPFVLRGIDVVPLTRGAALKPLLPAPLLRATA